MVSLIILTPYVGYSWVNFIDKVENGGFIVEIFIGLDDSL